MPPSAKLTGLPNGYPAIEACVEIVDIVPQVMLRTIQRAYAAWSPTAGTGTPVSRGLPGAWHVTRPASARSRVEVVPAILLVVETPPGPPTLRKSSRTRAVLRN